MDPENAQAPSGPSNRDFEGGATNRPAMFTRTDPPPRPPSRKQWRDATLQTIKENQRTLMSMIHDVHEQVSTLKTTVETLIVTIGDFITTIGHLDTTRLSAADQAELASTQADAQTTLAEVQAEIATILAATPPPAA